LLNLIGNAVKLTSQGEVVLRVEKQEETEEKVTRHFAVKDTGLGIALEKQQSIFESFAQADIRPRGVLEGRIGAYDLCAASGTYRRPHLGPNK
jgi:signal transduction histidine kinase